LYWCDETLGDPNNPRNRRGYALCEAHKDEAVRGGAEFENEIRSTHNT
jgi:hypothetical protein